MSGIDQPLPVRPDDPDAPIEFDRSKLHPRLIEIEHALSAAIAPVFREKKIKHAEYDQFREFLRALQELNIVDALFDSWLDRLTDETTADDWEGTPTNPEGPFYIPGAPLLRPIGPGASYVLPMRPDEPGTPLIVRGQVRSMDGNPLAEAELDIWQCTDAGVYSMVGADGLSDWNLRGRLRVDDEGRFELRTIKPVPYVIPGLPPVMLDLFAALGKTAYRPRHIHVKVRHDDIADNGQFTTQLYFDDDPYLPADPARLAGARLAMSAIKHEDPQELKARHLADHAFFLIADFDIAIATTHRIG